LVIILFVAGILAFNLVLAIYAQTIRGPPKKAFRPLEYTKFPRFFASLALIFYLLFCAGKASGSKVALSSILDFNYTIEQVGEMKLPVWFPKIWFPFAMPSLDINTILFIAAFMSAFRGHSIQSVSAFKMAAATSLIFSLTSYPSIVGAYEFYYFNNFNEWSDCYNYFFEGNQTGFFGYPSEDQAKLYCQAFRFSLAGITGMFILMHLVFISSFYCFYKNSHRASFDSDHNKTDLDGAGNQSNNQTLTLTSPLFAGSAGGQGRN